MGAVCRAASAAFEKMPHEKTLTLHYEAITADPAGVLKRIMEFLGESRGEAEIASATNDVSTGSVGKGRKALDGNVAQLMEIMHPTLVQLGYEAN